VEAHKRGVYVALTQLQSEVGSCDAYTHPRAERRGARSTPFIASTARSVASVGRAPAPAPLSPLASANPKECGVEQFFIDTAVARPPPRRVGEQLPVHLQVRRSPRRSAERPPRRQKHMRRSTDCRHSRLSHWRLKVSPRASRVHRLDTLTHSAGGLCERCGLRLREQIRSSCVSASMISSKVTGSCAKGD
jgi:hypothetical protein